MGGICKKQEAHRRAYNCWVNMKQRCKNPNHPNYESYGGRGISYHPDWDIFENFLEDMGEPPEGLTLERVDNNQGYSKGNCEWKTMAEQNANKRPQKVRHDNGTGIKGVGRRSDGSFLARTDQKSGTKLLYYGRSFEDAVAARKKWEAEHGNS
jgi:hypothetical protein